MSDNKDGSGGPTIPGKRKEGTPTGVATIENDSVHQEEEKREGKREHSYSGLRQLTQEEITKMYRSERAAKAAKKNVATHDAAMMVKKNDKNDDVATTGDSALFKLCDSCAAYDSEAQWCLGDDCDLLFELDQIGYNGELGKQTNPYIRREMYRHIVKKVLRIKHIAKPLDDMSEAELLKYMPECCKTAVIKGYPMEGGACNYVGLGFFDGMRKWRKDDDEDECDNVR